MLSKKKWKKKEYIEHFQMQTAFSSSARLFSVSLNVVQPFLSGLNVLVGIYLGLVQISQSCWRSESKTKPS